MRQRATVAGAIGALLSILHARPAEARDVLILSAGAVALVEPSEARNAGVGVGPAGSLGFQDQTTEVGRLSAGFELQGSAALGPRERVFADVWLGFVAVVTLTESAVNPFIALGPSVGWFQRKDEGTDGWVLGVRGDFGFQGILGSALFWRARVGFVGPGVGGVRGELSVGYAVD